MLQGSDKGGLFGDIGGLIGMIASGGNPLGAALGNAFGTALGGGNLEEALSSGIGGFFNSSMFGAPGLAIDAAGKAGVGIPGMPGPGMEGVIAGMSGTPAQQIKSAGVMSAIGAPKELRGAGIFGALAGQGGMNPIMGSLLREMLYQQQAPRFENLMSPLEMRQYETGSRLPDYRGTRAPAPTLRRPVVRKAEGGYIEGPGTGKSDSIPAMIYQNGGPVQEARLSDGEFVMTADAVRGAGGGDRNAGAAKMYRMMNQFERMA